MMVMTIKQSVLEDVIIENIIKSGIDNPVVVEGLVRDIIGTLKAGYNKTKSKMKDISSKTDEKLRKKEEKKRQQHSSDIKKFVQVS
jgi:hypothetical protein